MNERVWINFKELRARLKFEDVLRHYKVEVRTKGEQHHGSCPLPSHTGSDKAPCFSANLRRGIFQCFGCGAKGNVLEFAALMSGVDPKDGSALRKVAVELQTRFFPEGASTRTKRNEQVEAEAKPESQKVLVNAPLDFALKGLDAAHPYLLGRGFKPETIQHFGLGYCARGMLKDLLAIPLHDPAGKLVGYAGRAVDDAAASKGEPVYRFPETRERNGTVFRFDKSFLLYNSHRIEAPCDDLIVVRDFASVWWLHQSGFQRTVALMGWDLSEKQVELIVSLTRPASRIWIMPDEDKAGIKVAQSLLLQLSPLRFVRWVKLDEGQRPTDLSADALKVRLTA